VADDKTHIFICFSSKDEAVARGVVQFLETHGIPCWISLRDVRPGQNYQETIVHALERARGIVFLFSEQSAQSNEILKEISLGGGLNVPVFPLRLSPITPSGALRYELATRQWIDIFPDREAALAKLQESIMAVVGHPALTPVAATSTQPASAAIPAAAAPDPASTAPPIQTPKSPPKRRAKAARAPIVEAGSEDFEAIRILLAHHIGPIAKVLMQKAATAARSPDDFCEKLAAHVAAPAEREAFLKAARTRLSQRH
jgi:hypothetical protein